jgi:hypothetical protein
VLLPPEQVCIERVSRRVGHGFTDLPATRHMYRDFARSDVAARHVLAVAPGERASDTAASVRKRMANGSLVTRWG